MYFFIKFYSLKFVNNNFFNSKIFMKHSTIIIDHIRSHRSGILDIFWDMNLLWYNIQPQILLQTNQCCFWTNKNLITFFILPFIFKFPSNTLWIYLSRLEFFHKFFGCRKQFTITRVRKAWSLTILVLVSELWIHGSAAENEMYKNVSFSRK